MRFDLTEALIDDILFAMEDQMGEFMLDRAEANFKAQLQPRLRAFDGSVRDW